MHKGFATLACFLASMVLGFSDLRLPSSGSCPAADSCCCSAPESVDSCLCGDHAPTGIPEMVTFADFPSASAPQAKGYLIGEIMPPAGLLPKWRPTVPWHAPPKEKRVRLSVWIL